MSTKQTTQKTQSDIRMIEELTSTLENLYNAWKKENEGWDKPVVAHVIAKAKKHQQFDIDEKNEAQNANN